MWKILLVFIGAAAVLLYSLGCGNADAGKKEFLAELRSGDSRTRSNAFTRLQKRLEDPTSSDVFDFDRDAVFKELTGHFAAEPDSFIFQNMVWSMLLIDHKRGLDAVIAANVLRADFRHIETLIAVLAIERAVIPWEKAKPIADVFREKCLKWPDSDRACGPYRSILTVLAMSSSKDAEPLIVEVLASTNDQWRLGGAAARAAQAGVKAMLKDRINRQFNTKGAESLTPEQKVYQCVDDACDDFSERTLDQLFKGPERGRPYKPAIVAAMPEALETIGAADAAVIVREAIDLHTKFKSEAIDEVQYEKASEDLLARFQKIMPDVRVKLLLYLAAHPEPFR